MSDDDLSNSLKISTDVLFEKLTEISSVRRIERVDLYGGEIGLLRKDYFEELKSIIKVFYKEQISVISNLSVLQDYFDADDIDLSVSWDFKAREKHEIVYQNMQRLQRPFHVLVLASEEVLGLSDIELADFIGRLNKLPKLETLEIKPYSLNPHHVQSVTFTRYEEFIKKWIAQKETFSFEFINENKIQQSLNGATNSWSDDHLYITPDGSWAVLEFDQLNREYFKKVKSYQEYLTWTQQEKARVHKNMYCQKCDYLGRCLSEHLQYIFDISEGCNGFKGLLDWYSKAHLKQS